MSDFPASAVGSFLSVLRTLPVWVLAGLALAGYAVLFAPGFAGIEPTDFRDRWGTWIWIEAIVFSVLAIVRGIDASARAYLTVRRSRGHRALRFVPLHHQRWWHLAKQRDDSFI